MEDSHREALDRFGATLRRWIAGELDVAHVVDEAASLAQDATLDDPVVAAVLRDLAHAHETLLTEIDVPIILDCLKYRAHGDSGDAGYAEHVKSIDRAARRSRLHRNPFYPQQSVRCATWGPSELPPVVIHDHEGGREAAIEYFRSATGRSPDLRDREFDREILEDRVVRIRVDGRGRPSIVEVFPNGAEQITRVQFWRYKWTGTALDRNTVNDLLADWEAERITVDQIEQEALHYRSIIDPPSSKWSPWACGPWDVMERLAVASLSPLWPVDAPVLRAFLSTEPSGYEAALLTLMRYFSKLDWDARRAALHPGEKAFLERLHR